MVIRGGASIVVVLLAYGCSSPAKVTGGSADGGGDGESAEAAACSGSDVMCGGVCQHESVSACGTSCTTCAQPATSHGQSSCLDGVCQFECALGYERCGTQGCCGNMTRGDIAEIAVGGESSCAVTTAGLVWCWGDDSYGALGDGNTAGTSVMPVQGVNLPPTAQHVALGGHHTCALLGGGRVACWGGDRQGQLGDGQFTPRGTPVEPVGHPLVTRIATGESHTCAIAQGGAILCWGSNTSGQLGNTTAPSSTASPVTVTGLTGAIDLAAGAAFTCALVGGGKVYCWGDGANGQLGGPASSGTPV